MRPPQMAANDARCRPRAAMMATYPRGSVTAADIEGAGRGESAAVSCCEADRSRYRYFDYDI